MHNLYIIVLVRRYSHATSFVLSIVYYWTLGYKEHIVTTIIIHACRYSGFIHNTVQVMLSGRRECGKGLSSMFDGTAQRDEAK